MEKSGVSSGRTSMRSSRSPFFMVALLFVTAFLAFSYWKQTRRNGALSNELETLQIDFRAVSDKHLYKEKQVAEMATQLENAKSKLMKMEAQAGESGKKFQDAENEKNAVKEQLKKAKEAEETAKKDVEKAQKEKSDYAGEVEKLKKQLTEAQNAPKVCDKPACKEHLREVLKAVIASVGKPPVSGALKSHNVDIMAVAGDLLEGTAEEKSQDQPAAQS